MPLALEKFDDRRSEAGFSNAGLAAEQHSLAFALGRLRPVAPQQVALFLAADEGGHPARMQCLEAARRGARPQHGPGLHRSGDALQGFHPEVFELEQIAKKPSRTFADDDRVRLGDALQTGCEVRGLADDARGQIAHHHPGGDANPELLGNTRVETGDGGDQIEPCPHRPLSVVLVGVGIAKVRQDAVPHILSYGSAELAYGFARAARIGRKDVPQILRIHAGGERRRTDQVGEHDGELPAFGAF